jgi:hypothetical protein
VDLRVQLGCPHGVSGIAQDADGRARRNWLVGCERLDRRLVLEVAEEDEVPEAVGIGAVDPDEIAIERPVDYVIYSLAVIPGRWCLATHLVGYGRTDRVGRARADSSDRARERDIDPGQLAGPGRKDVNPIMGACDVVFLWFQV